MNLFRMRGAWGPAVTAAYNTVVVPALTELYEERFDALFPSGLGPTGARVLDVGCGPGHAVGLLAERYAQSDFVGLDLSPDMIREARRRHDGLANLAFREGDALALPFADASFDVALSLASIKHWPEPARGLSQMFRVVRPGGSVLVLEADRRASFASCRRFVGRWRYLLPFTETLATAYFHRFVAGGGVDEDAIAALLTDAGFAEVQVASVPDFPAVIGRAVRP